MPEQKLTDDEARVMEAVATLETAGSPRAVDAVAAEAGLPVDRTHAALRALSHEHGVVHEVQDTATTDLGPYYDLAPRGT